MNKVLDFILNRMMTPNSVVLNGTMQIFQLTKKHKSQGSFSSGTQTINSKVGYNKTIMYNIIFFSSAFHVGFIFEQHYSIFVNIAEFTLEIVFIERLRNEV